MISLHKRWPWAYLLNVRTMEVFHEMGVADGRRMAASAAAPHAPDAGWWCRSSMTPGVHPRR